MNMKRPSKINFSDISSGSWGPVLHAQANEKQQKWLREITEKPERISGRPPATPVEPIATTFWSNSDVCTAHATSAAEWLQK